MLSTSSARVVTATLPAVRSAATRITDHFYTGMFSEHPELLDLFNRGNQANGEQRRALAGAVIAYAEHLIGSGDVPMGRMVSRIAHKHASLGIRPEQYTIVGHHLARAVAITLGEAVTTEVAAAWDEVYWLFAVRLIAEETRLCLQAGVDPKRPRARWRIVDRITEAYDAVSLLLIPESGPVPDHAPGQYVTVGVDLPGIGRQARQYTVSHAPGHSALRITVRPVRGVNGNPDGMVSTFLVEHTRIGDVVSVSHPFGDLVLDDQTTPLILASAGIGITPMAAMIEHIADTRPDRPVVAVHAERSVGRHALRDHVARHGSRLTAFTHLRFYEDTAPTTPSGVHNGLIRADLIPLAPNTSAYLCGPLPFMREVRTSLLRRGVPPSRIHYEVFGSDLWTTNADQLPIPTPTG